MEILTIRTKEHEKILRKKTEEFAFANFSKKEIKELIAKMRQVMKMANGIGLAANQIGLPYRVFVAEIPDRNGKLKFYAFFNPKLEFVSEKKLLLDEGCLSVPGVFGTVERSEKIILRAQDKNGRSIKIKAWGLLAHVIQHEMDHLDGKIFTDKAKMLYKKEVDDVAKT